MVSNPMGRDPDVTVGIGGDASGLESAVSSAVESLGSLRGAAGMAGAALAGLGAAGMAGATKAAADFEQQMVEVEKVTNPEIASEMAGSIREMSSEMPIAQDELAGIAAQAGRFGVEGTDNMEKFTESVAKMAVSTDLSSQQAGEAFARMATLMDEPISNIENVGDAVNGLSNSMATSASEITNASTRSSGALSQLGLQTDQILALNATMNEVSASSRIAGTRLRRFAQEMMNPQKASDLAAALGMSVEEFTAMREESPNELMQQMVQRFQEGGESADKLRTALSTTSRQALASLAQNTDGWATAQETANEQMGEGESLTEEYNAAADTFNNKLQVLQNRVRNAAIGIGNDLLPIMTGLVESTTEAFDAFGELNDMFDANVGTIALVSTTLAGLTVALWAFAPAAAAAVAAAAPIIAVVGAIAVAIAALWIAWEENLFGIQDTTETVFGTVQDVVQKTLGAITDTWNRHGSTLVSSVRGVFQAILGVYGAYLNLIWTEIIRPVLQTIKSAWRENGQDIMSDVRQIFNGISNIIKTVVTAIWTNVIKPTLDLIQAGWSRWGDDILRLVRGVFGGIETLVSTAIRNTIQVIDGLTDLMTGDFKGAFNSAKSVVKNSMNAVESIIDGALDPIETAIGKVADAITDAFDGIEDTVKNGITYLTDTGEGTLVGDIKAAFSGIGDAVGGAIKKAINDALGLPFKKTIGKIEVKGKTIFGGKTIHIPELAEGGIVTEETLSMVGENGPEAVLPLDKMDQFIPRGDGGRSGDKINNFEITVHARDGTDAGKKIKRELKRADV